MSLHVFLDELAKSLIPIQRNGIEYLVVVLDMDLG
jgi:hypothetical protein